MSIKSKDKKDSTGLLVVKLFYISNKTTLIYCYLSCLLKDDRLRKYIAFHKILAKNLFNLNLIQFAMKSLIWWWVNSILDSNRIQDMAL